MSLAETAETSTPTGGEHEETPKNVLIDYDVLTGNNTKLKKAEDLNDFIWVMNDEPHASRRKEMIKKYPEIKKLMGHEPLTKYIVLVLWSFHLGLAIHLRDEALGGGSLKFWLCAYVFGGTSAQALFLACHEISHNLAFKSFDHNKMFGIFTNMPLLVPFFAYFKYYHNEHHKYQGVDGVDTDIPTSFEAKLLSNFIGKLFFLTFQVWFYAIRPVFVKAPKVNYWVYLNYVACFGFIGVIYLLFGHGPLVYMLASAGIAGSLHPIASHFIAEHYVFVGEAETYSYYGPMNKLTWNVGYHNEHHDFPTVPWTRLPKLYEILKKEYYGKMPYHKSWIMVMMNFLFNEHITLYNRVKRQDKHGLSKQDVAGNAEYTGAWLLGTGFGIEKAGKTE